MYKKELTGMRVLIVSQILQLISEVLIIASTVFSYVSGDTIDIVFQDVTGNLKSFMVFMALDSFVFFFSFVSTIICAVGLIMLSRYERKFLPAVFSLIVGYAATFVTYMTIGKMIADVIPVFIDVMLLVTTLTVMEGIMRIAYRINDEKLYSFGDLFVKLSAAIYVINMLCSICALIFSSSYSYDDVSAIFSAASIIIELTINIMYFVLIVRAVKSLKNCNIIPEQTPAEIEEADIKTASA